jgi:hypothetical protein
VFSDLHRGRERAERLVELSLDADVVVGGASAFASGTGPRSAASEIVVAHVNLPVRSITAASAVGPSSHGVENTK